MWFQDGGIVTGWSDLHGTKLIFRKGESIYSQGKAAGQLQLETLPEKWRQSGLTLREQKAQQRTCQLGSGEEDVHLSKPGEKGTSQAYSTTDIMGGRA